MHARLKRESSIHPWRPLRTSRAQPEPALETRLYQDRRAKGEDFWALASDAKLSVGIEQRCGLWRHRRVLTRHTTDPVLSVDYTRHVLGPDRRIAVARHPPMAQQQQAGLSDRPGEIVRQPIAGRVGHCDHRPVPA